MPMPPYAVLCYRTGCGRPAAYKVAARWSDGVTEELKTYSLCCEECLPDLFRRGRERQAPCRTAPGEVLEPPGIYRMRRGQRDVQLERLPELETKLSG
jgi:hypothetical protein